MAQRPRTPSGRIARSGRSLRRACPPVPMPPVPVGCAPPPLPPPPPSSLLPPLPLDPASLPLLPLESLLLPQPSASAHDAAITVQRTRSFIRTILSTNTLLTARGAETIRDQAISAQISCDSRKSREQNPKATSRIARAFLKPSEAWDADPGRSDGCSESGYVRAASAAIFAPASRKLVIRLLCDCGPGRARRLRRSRRAS